MANESEALATLELLLNEFFAPETGNERKREIESILQNFSNQQGAWKHYIYFMTHSSNQYVCMYSLNTIEKLVTKQWLGLMWEERAQLKSTLYQFTLEHSNAVPNFIRNKLVKLVVDIARLDWPHFYPDFFTNILELIRKPETTNLGLLFLQTSSEELICPWEDLSVSRKEELRRLLLAHIPEVFSVLTNLFERIAQKQQRSIAATPPPSPTLGQPNSASPDNTVYEFSKKHSPGSADFSLFWKKLSQRDLNSKVSALSSLTGSEQYIHCILDSDSATTCCLALKALAHLFSWVPLSSYITPNLIAAVFQLTNITQATSALEGQCVGTLAIAAINEIMYKNCVPASCEDFLFNILKQATQLMHSLMEIAGLNEVEESYKEKLIEFLQVYVGLHLHRLKNKPEKSLADFVDILLKYTFQQTNLDHFYNCLDVVNVFLDQLHSDREDMSRHCSTFVVLVERVLQKIQFRYNQSELEELDDKTLDDDEQTEWQKFLRQNIEILAKVAELNHLIPCSLVCEPWKEVINVYMHLEHAVDRSVNRLSITAEHECVRLHCMLRDLSSLTQAMGRMYPHFIGEMLVDQYPRAQEVAGQLINMATYAARVQLHHLQVSPPIIAEDLIEVHAQVLAALKAWCHWLAQLRKETVLQSTYEQFVRDIVQSTCPLLSNSSEPQKIYHSAAHLLHTFSNTVRPFQLWEAEPIQKMYHFAPQMNYLQPETRRLVHRSLCSIVLLPCHGVPSNDQCWEQRHKLLADLVGALTADFHQLVPGSPQSQHVITDTLLLLGDLIETTCSEGINTKKLLFSVIQMSIHKALSLFPTYARVPDVCEVILDFCLRAFSGLQQQLGVSFTENTVQSFLDFFTREQLSTSIAQQGGAEARVVEKFLQLLQLVVAEPAARFKHFVPSTITLCLEHVYPLVAESPSPEIKPALFGLFHAVLMHKWQYFYKNNVLQSLSQNGGCENVDNKEQFTAILRAYGQSLLQPDINIIGQNLKSLEQLNAKWKLYHKSPFREELLPQFLTVLFHSLIHKSHALLEEEITVAIYNMATVNFTAFYSEYLPLFLQSVDSLDNDQRGILLRNFKQEVDLPSFTQNLQILVNDLRCYRLCNSSLHAGNANMSKVVDGLCV